MQAETPGATGGSERQRDPPHGALPTPGARLETKTTACGVGPAWCRAGARPPELTTKLAESNLHVAARRVVELVQPWPCTTDPKTPLPGQRLLRRAGRSSRKLLPHSSDPLSRPARHADARIPPGAPVANRCCAFPQPAPGTRARRTRPTPQDSSCTSGRRASPTRSRVPARGGRAPPHLALPSSSATARSGLAFLAGAPWKRFRVPAPGREEWAGSAGACTLATNNYPGAHQRAASSSQNAGLQSSSPG